MQLLHDNYCLHAYGKNVKLIIVWIHEPSGINNKLFVSLAGTDPATRLIVPLKN